MLDRLRRWWIGAVCLTPKLVTPERRDDTHPFLSLSLSLSHTHTHTHTHTVSGGGGAKHSHYCRDLTWVFDLGIFLTWDIRL